MGGREQPPERGGVPDDAACVAVQIERRPRSAVEVVARCHLGLPVVIAVPPHLEDGTPFPTHYWLTCPLAVKRIGRLEGAGGVRAADDRIASEPGFAERYQAAMAAYAATRDALVDPALPNPPAGGVGGSRRGVKCLHAHYAHHVSGADNPVGEDVAADIEPLNCEVPCVVAAPEGAVRNPEWREPQLPS